MGVVISLGPRRALFERLYPAFLDARPGDGVVHNRVPVCSYAVIDCSSSTYLGETRSSRSVVQGNQKGAAASVQVFDVSTLNFLG